MYIDPAAGSLVLQLLIAGSLAAAATMRNVRTAVVSFFKSLGTRSRER